MKKITKIEVPIKPNDNKKRVAAYARVSTTSERLKHSLSAQISYYNTKIQNEPNWEFVEIYADEYITGTSTKKRTEFNRMIDDCKKGKIDIILTKSVSRFARNTVDLLETIRYLKSIGVEVRFEKENINSMSGDGELMLTILASYAQEEIRSISDNIKWRMRKEMQKGKLNAVTSFHILGYEWENENLVVIPEEANVVKRIFDEYELGNSLYKIANNLNSDGITTKKGCKWNSEGIQRILKNITYTGNIMFQKQYIVDPITQIRKNNTGELPQYYVENSHEPIIDKSRFDRIQELMKARNTEKPWLCHVPEIDVFRRKLICKRCGKKYWHTGWASKPTNLNYWIHGSSSNSAHRCESGIQINHNNLKKTSASVLHLNEFDAKIFSENIESIYVNESHILEFHFYDGRVVTEECRNTGKTDYWTQEKKKEMSLIRQDISYIKNKSIFTSKIKCGVCKCNFRKCKQKGKQSPDGYYYYWRCAVHGQECMATGLRDDILREIIAGMTHSEKFDESEFTENFSYIVVNGQCNLEFHYNDGRVSNVLYKHPSINPNLRWGSDRKSTQSKVIKKYHKERERYGNKKGNNNTGNKTDKD